jgi:hypothetical protein
MRNDEPNRWYRKGRRAGYRRGFVDGLMFMMMGTLAMFIAMRCSG